MYENGNMSPADMAAVIGNNDGMNFGGGGAWWWIIILFLFGMNGGWGNGMNGGLGNIYPWMNQQSQMNDGFRDQMIAGKIDSIGNNVISGFGDTQLGIAGINQNICQTGNGIVAAINGAQNSLVQQGYANQIAMMQGQNAIQGQIAQSSCDQRYATAQLQNVVQTEACADRNALSQALFDVTAQNNTNTQKILDKLCALELDGVKGQLEQSRRENLDLQNQLNIAAMRESQTAQNALISQGFANEVDQLYNRLNTCPVPTTPVYGRTPIFTCGGNTGCGCSGAFAG